MSQRASITQIDGKNPMVLVYHYRLFYEASLTNDQREPNPKLMLASEFRQLVDNERNRENRNRENRTVPTENVMNGDVKFLVKQLPEDRRKFKWLPLPLRLERRKIMLCRKDLKDVPADDQGANDLIAVINLPRMMEKKWKKKGNGRDELYVISTTVPGTPKQLTLDKKGKEVKRRNSIVVEHQE